LRIANSEWQDENHELQIAFITREIGIEKSGSHHWFTDSRLTSNQSFTLLYQSVISCQT